ncbi:MAG: radical SAM protein [Deltaproteobacteria bacterium]|nr:radical SAM protein [Deltaproteobacteria bacterium]
MDALIAITYRCNARCQMCSIWRYPTKPSEEIQPKHLRSIPAGLRFANITGGEPFVRDDVEEFLKVLKEKVKRIVISTNGYFTDKIMRLAKKHSDVGIRISIEGLPRANDELRGLHDGFDRGLRTLLELHQYGLKDIGFGITVSDRNILEMMKLYEMAKMMNLEFATAVVHNTYYFHKFDNNITKVKTLNKELDQLTTDMLKSKKMKNWFRAYFNYGLKNYVNGGKRLLPCKAGTNLFFVDPFGDLRPCNGMEITIGNLKINGFKELWNSKAAEEMRKKVEECDQNCWMIGSVAPIMRERIWIPALWIMRHKLQLLWEKKICMDDIPKR